MLYTGNRLDAQEALRLGLVDHVVSRSQLLSKCEEIATEICKSAPLAVQKIKQAVRKRLVIGVIDGADQGRSEAGWQRSAVSRVGE